MSKRRLSKFIHEGEYVADYLTLDDAQKLDDVRAALRRRDLETATQLAQVFKLIPVTA